jgi:hypothetical protein
MNTRPNDCTKRVLIVVIFILLFCSDLLFAQTKTTIGFSAGYGMLNMKEVNADLEDTYQLIHSLGVPAPPPKEIGGGLFLDGSVLVRLNNTSFGAGINYATGKGNISYTDYSGSIEESYDASTIEIMSIIGTSIPFNQTVALSLRCYAGYGLASVSHIGRFTFFSSPQDNIDVTHDVSGGYFSGRVQGGVEMLVEPVILSFALAYRIANAGVLKGNMTRDGISYSNVAIKNVRGGDIEFDFSGITLLVSVQFRV